MAQGPGLRHKGHHDFLTRIKAECNSVNVALVRQAMQMHVKARLQFHLLPWAFCVASISVGIDASI